MFDITVIGGGIVGLATAKALSERFPAARLLVLEKEQDWAAHQTGRNSGVIHSGIYYKPGSLKARLCQEGNQALLAFCRAQNIPFSVCGKLIVATEAEELPRLEALFMRGQENGLEVRRLSAHEAREFEPQVACLAALHVTSTGIVNYTAVCRAYAAQVEARGGCLQTGTRVTGLRDRTDGLTLETNRGAFETKFVINCAGLHSDRIARLAGQFAARIVPFRGEYYELRQERCELVRGLIYPVPDPDFPFLGVHLTRMIDGSVHAGPNAVLSFKREGYHRLAFSLRDCSDTLSYPGFWRLAARHAAEGLREMRRSFSPGLFTRSLQRLVPAIRREDLMPAAPGVRAQAITPAGALVDDFLILEGRRSLHVCNAPSPAATASLAIGQEIAGRVPDYVKGFR